MSDSYKITQEDLNAIKYFHTEKGDVTRWCDWDKKKAFFKEQYPVQATALENLITAQQTADYLIRNL